MPQEIPYSHWTLHQQMALWRELANQSLPHWGLRHPELDWLGYGSNAVFKVIADAGEYVLRLHPPGSMAAPRLRSELAWLRHIRENTDLHAPMPLPPHNAEEDGHFIALTNPALPPPHLALACLFEFIPGQAKSAQALRARDICAIGRYLARLHTAAQFDPPADFDRPRLDADGFFADDSPYELANDAGLSAAQLDICRQAENHVAAVMARLSADDASFGLIHADLLTKNILFTADGLAALDFEFCAWGFYLYDLAPILWQLKGERAADYPALESALWDGYAALRPSAESERFALETMIAARQLASCAWLLQNRQNPQVREMAPALLSSRIEQLRHFLDGGKLQRSTVTL